jgi:ArsR family transcriptional regulator
MDDFEYQSKLFKVLMHPARLAILDNLRPGEECVCHMEAMLGLRQAYISQQLMILREAGLVEDRRDGWNIFYRVVRPQIYSVIDAMNQFVSLKASPATLPGRKSSPSCPCPKCNPAGLPALLESPIPVENQP